MDGDSVLRPEDALRLLANAVGASRLYPPTSPIPKEAAERFTQAANALSAFEPLRFNVEPHTMRIGGAEIAGNQGNIPMLAEALHAMQVRQVIIIPGLTIKESEAFMSLLCVDPVRIRASGGLRASLARVQVNHMGVVEVALRSSDESGLLGIDLLLAPTDELNREIGSAAERWVKEASEGEGTDEMTMALERLEDASRELALERISQAFMRLDDQTRMRLLAMSLKADTTGKRMDGLLSAFSRMKPAALARLLKLVGAQANVEPGRMVPALKLPEEAAEMVSLILRPSPDIVADYAVPGLQEAGELAEVVRQGAEDAEDIERQRAAASPELAAGRALNIAIRVSMAHPDAEAVRAMGEVIAPAARLGQFDAVERALDRLEEIGQDPSVSEQVKVALSGLADTASIVDMCSQVLVPQDALVAARVVCLAGAAGAEALLEAYLRSSERQRTQLRPVLRAAGEAVLAVARPRMRSADAHTTMGILRALSALGDSRAVQLIAERLNTSTDETIRFTAITSLAAMSSKEATEALIRALGHRDTETQRYVTRELGRIRAAAAVPALLRRFDDIGVLARGHELRKDIIAALIAIDTPEAEKTLKRIAARPGIGRKSRELKMLAQQVSQATEGEDEK